MADEKKNEHPEWEKMFEDAREAEDSVFGGSSKAVADSVKQDETPVEPTEQVEDQAETAGAQEVSEGTETEQTEVEPTEGEWAEEQPTETEETSDGQAEPEAEQAEVGAHDVEGAEEAQEEPVGEQSEFEDATGEASEAEDEIKITAQVHEDDGEVHQAKEAKAEKKKFKAPNWLKQLASIGIGVAVGIVLCMAIIGTSNHGKLTDTLPAVTAPAVTANVNMANPELVVNIAQKSRALGPKGVDTLYGMLGDDTVIDWYNHTYKETFGKYGWKVDHSETGPVTLKKRGCNAVVTLEYALAGGENAIDSMDVVAYNEYTVKVKDECLNDKVYYDGISWRGVHLGDDLKTVKERMYDSEFVEMNPDERVESWNTSSNTIFDYETLSDSVVKCFYSYECKRLAFTFIRDRLVKVYVEVPYQPLEGLGNTYGDSFGAFRELSDTPLALWDNSLDNTFCALGFGSAYEKAKAEGKTADFPQSGWWDLVDSPEYPGAHVKVNGMRHGYVERFNAYMVYRDNVAVTTVPDIRWRGLTWVNGENDFLRMYGDALSEELEPETGYRHLVFVPYEGARLHVWFSKDQVVKVMTDWTTQYSNEEWAKFAETYRLAQDERQNGNKG